MDNGKRKWWLPWHWTTNEKWAVALIAVIASQLFYFSVMRWAWRESDWVMAQPWFPYVERALKLLRIW